MLNTLKNLINPITPAVYLQNFSNSNTKLSGTKKSTPKETTKSEVTTPTDSSLTTENQLKSVKLIMVTAANNNKFYEMQENGDTTFTVMYGRIGANKTTRTYPIHQWDKKYKEKIRKGYRDLSSLVVTNKVAEEFSGIDDQTVRYLITNLFRYAKKSIQSNYYVSSEEVTIHQVESAQRLLTELSQNIDLKMNVVQFNKDLLELYQIIPRKMSHVKNHLIQQPTNQDDLTEIEALLAKEQATLDVMASQVELNKSQKETVQVAPDVLAQLGLQISPIEATKAIEMIKEMMGDDKDKFQQAFQVTNINTQPHFDKFVKKSTNKKTKLFWHGSRNENWLSILKTGLILRPTNAVITGKMFGYGLYFADKCRKSLNYTSLRGSYWAGGSQNTAFMALFEVHTGAHLQLKVRENWCGDLTEEKLKKRNTKYDSVFAKGGADLINNEYIVYNQHQCTVKYLVELRD
ncbi:MAG: WGR domain-containing protein [Saprospiraceae bacterium]